MTSDVVVGAIIGVALTVVLGYVIGLVRVRDLRRALADDLADRDAAILELRRELAEDKETNRRLRHELAVRTPGNLLETAATAEMERNGALSERDQVIEQLELVERDLTAARARVTRQDAKLRRYREALQEIRISLEAQGRDRESVGEAGSMLDTAEINGEIDDDIDDEELIGEHVGTGTLGVADIGAGD